MGIIDFLAWGIAQTGDWGAQSHSAGAIAVEGGFQPKGLDAVKPWFRGGYLTSTGDNNPNDDKHGTFFQILPTPRIYARTPFYNLMNLNDVFGELVLRPHSKLNIRADTHGLRLAEKSDLWYLGGGAFNPSVFGYVGRPSLGGRISGYYGYANGKSVMAAIYANGKNLNFGYLELTYTFGK